MDYLVVLAGGQRFPAGTTVTAGAVYQRRWGSWSWDLGYPFPELDEAKDAALSYIQTHDANLEIREGGVKGRPVWWSKHLNIEAEWRYEVALQHDGAKLPQPINVDREQIITRLQTQLDEEAAEREKVEAKERQARLGVDQFVTDHQDEIVEYLGRYLGGSWRQVEERLAELFKDDAYKPSKLRKGRKETDLEKMVRVLAMSTDKTIEVQPDSSIYSLL